MDQRDAGRTSKTERRTELDGGLDQRAGVFTATDRVLSCQNFRFSERGSLTARKGGSRLVTVNGFSALSAMPAPVLVASLAGGTLATGTYTVSYTMATVLGTKIGVSATAAVAVTGPTGSISIRIAPVNSGETAGTTSAGADDPFNGGYVQTSALIEVYVTKDGDPTTKQTVVAPAWDGTILAQVTDLTAYTTNGASPPSANQAIPIRSIFWHPGLDATLGFIGESGFHLSGAHTAATFIGKATDKNNATFGFPRLPTRIHHAIVNNVAVVTDGVGKPKKLHIGTLSDPTTWQWRLCGANPPGAAPTLLDLAVAGNVNGTVQYLVTYTYSTTLPDGSSYTVESNSSASVSIAVVNSQVRVTRPSYTESGGSTWSVYRTVSGGSTFFLVQSGIAAGTTNITDNNADANLNTSVTPPGLNGDPGHAVPTAGLHFVTEFAQRLWAAKTSVVKDGANRILRLRATNEVVCTRFEGTGTIGGAVDSWNTTVNCGSFSPITGLKSFRGLLYVFKQDEVGVIEGDNDSNFAYRTIWHNSGAMENSIVVCDDSLYCFDQARTVLRIAGYSVQDVGYEYIQPGWLAGFSASSSIGFREGGGRAATSGNGMMPLAVVYDPIQGECRWTMSDFAVDLNINAQAAYTPSFYEYVMRKMPDGRAAFSVFTGSASGSVSDRRIGGQALAVVGTTIYQTRTVLYCDYHGKVVADDQVEGDLDNTVAITVRAVWPFFFGDNPEMVKLFRSMFVMLTTGATAADALIFKASSLAKQTGAGVPKTIATVNGGSTEVQVVKLVPAAPFDTVRPTDRGFLLTLDGTKASGPTRIRALASKYEDLSDERSAT